MGSRTFFFFLVSDFLHSDTGGAGQGPSEQTSRDRGYPVSAARGRVGGRGDVGHERRS